MLLLVLLPTEVNAVTKEKSCKENMVGAFGSGSGKVFLTFLIKVIIFYIRLTIIYVR